MSAYYPRHFINGIVLTRQKDEWIVRVPGHTDPITFATEDEALAFIETTIALQQSGN